MLLCCSDGYSYEDTIQSIVRTSSRVDMYYLPCMIHYYSTAYIRATHNFHSSFYSIISTSTAIFSSFFSLLIQNMILSIQEVDIWDQNILSLQNQTDDRLNNNKISILSCIQDNLIIFLKMYRIIQNTLVTHTFSNLRHSIFENSDCQCIFFLAPKVFKQNESSDRNRKDNYYTKSLWNKISMYKIYKKRNFYQQFIFHTRDREHIVYFIYNDYIQFFVQVLNNRYDSQFQSNQCIWYIQLVFYIVCTILMRIDLKILQYFYQRLFSIHIDKPLTYICIYILNNLTMYPLNSYTNLRDIKTSRIIFSNAYSELTNYIVVFQQIGLLRDIDSQDIVAVSNIYYRIVNGKYGSQMPYQFQQRHLVVFYILDTLFNNCDDDPDLIAYFQRVKLYKLDKYDRQRQNEYYKFVRAIQQLQDKISLMKIY